MENFILSQKARAEAQEIFRAWLLAVDIFLKSPTGDAVLKRYTNDMRGVFRSALIAQVQVPDSASEHLKQAIWDLRQEKRDSAKIQLHAVLFTEDRDDALESEWVALEASARGNVSSIKRIATGSVSSINVQEARPTLPAPAQGVGTPTIPVAYSPDALGKLALQDLIPLQDLFGQIQADEINSKEGVENRQANSSPGCSIGEDAVVEVLEETSTSEMDEYFQEDWSKP